MYQQEYYVPKSSGTLADPLLAYGLAMVLREVIRHAPGHSPYRRYPVTIEDQGFYVIRLSEPIQQEWIETTKVPVDLAMPVLRIAKPKEPKADGTVGTKPKVEKKALPVELGAIDYNAIWDEIRKESELIDAHFKRHGTHQELQDLRESFVQQPHRDVALLIGDYRMQVEGIHNQAVVQWFTTTGAGYQAASIRAILMLFTSPLANVEAIAKAWGKEVKLEGVKTYLTASQVYNPSMGKGQNRPKADQLSMGNEQNFWLVEYLKAVGLFIASAPRAFTDDGMRKTYVIAPTRIELSDHEAIFNRFKRNLYGVGDAPIKADILTVLDYASAYLSYCVEAKLQDDGPFERNPHNSITGFNVASYMLLSQNSFTTINLSFLGLPPWLRAIDAVEDVLPVQDVIEEQRAIIRPLQEKHQEANHLLDSYRDFLTGHRLDAFFDFCTGYGEYIVRSIPENTRIKQLSTALLDEIFRRIAMPDQELLNPNDLTEFVSSAGKHEGFHRIAYAIRRSTVIPQRQNANAKSDKSREKSLYDVRYGLGNNLRRKTDSAGEFMEALTEFIQIYNAETEQVFENTSEQRAKDPKNYARLHYRQRVNEEDLDDVLQLVAKYGPQLVCNMLMAYGYARKRRKGEGVDDTDDESFVEDDAVEAAQ